MVDPQSLAEALRSARESVDAADLPEDLRVPAFEKALAALLPISSSTPSPGPDLGEDNRESDEVVSPAITRTAGKLRVGEGLVGRVLDFDEEGVHILVPRSRFPKPKSEAIQDVAILVVGGRQASGLDPDGWTHQSFVRHATEVLGVDDHSNFAAHMKKLAGVRSRGSGRTGELKMNAVGFEAAGDLIRRLTSETDG